MFNPCATVPTASLRQVKQSQLRHSAAEKCLCRKLSQTGKERVWGQSHKTVWAFPGLLFSQCLQLQAETQQRLWWMLLHVIIHDFFSCHEQHSTTLYYSKRAFIFLSISEEQRRHRWMLGAHVVHTRRCPQGRKTTP